MATISLEDIVNNFEILNCAFLTAHAQWILNEGVAKT